MAHPIRLGFVGANVRSTWASQSHFPALLASPDIELTAVCTTRLESAEEARRAFGAQRAFQDYRTMVASPEIDAVAVVVKVPEHYAPTRAALEAASTSIPSGRWDGPPPKPKNWRRLLGPRGCRRRSDCNRASAPRSCT